MTSQPPLISLSKDVQLNDTSDPRSLSTKFRAKRDVRLRALISTLAEPGKPVRILDLGGSVEYWHRVGVEFLKSQRASVFVLNHLESELRRGEDATSLFTTIVGDACDLPQFSVGEFDLVHSNSVIEHVGNWGRMKQFALEARRVGRSYYIQTPYYWFPVDPHYYRAPMIHWMPRPVQADLMARFHICHAGKAANLDDAFSMLDGTQLLTRRQFSGIFPDAKIFFEKVAGLTKSLIAVRMAAPVAQ